MSVRAAVRTHHVTVRCYAESLELSLRGYGHRYVRWVCPSTQCSIFCPRCQVTDGLHRGSSGQYICMTKRRADQTSTETITRQSNRTRRGSASGSLYGRPTQDTDPAEVLLNEIRRTAGHIEWLGDNLRNSDPQQFVRGLWLAKRQSGFIKEDEIDTGDLSQAGAMWLELYLTERRHLATICRTALAAGIEERRVRLAERQAERVGQAFRGVLFDLAEHFKIEIDPEDEAVRAIVYKALMQAGGATPLEDEPRKTMRLEIES